MAHPFIGDWGVSCTGLPKIDPVNLSTIPEIHQRCSDVFLDGKWQLDHLIEFAMPGNKKSFVRGITVISYGREKNKSVIMTIEGFVFLDAYYDQKVIINRGIPPFDSIDFVRGMMDDIKLMFFKPETDPIESGISGDGHTSVDIKMMPVALLTSLLIVDATGK